MGRLDSHKQKQEKQRALLLGGAIILVLILLFTYGIKFVINTSVFVNEKIGKNKENNTDTRVNDNDFGTVDIYSLPEATNSARIIVSGVTSNFSSEDELVFYINDEEVHKERNPINDAFSAEIGDLKPGDNTIYAKGKKKNSKTVKKSEEFTVVYKNEKPKLEISEPGDNSRTYNSDIKIAGNTDKGNTVRINGGPAVVDSQGHFQTNVRLKEGENTITIVALDDAGNREERILTVTYQKDE